MNRQEYLVDLPSHRPSGKALPVSAATRAPADADRPELAELMVDGDGSVGYVMTRAAAKNQGYAGALLDEVVTAI